MDPILLLLLLGGGFFLAARKPKKKAGKYTNLPPGDYPVKIGQQLHLKLPREAGFWSKTPIGTPAGDVKVFARKGDPLNVLRVEGVTPGAIKVSMFADAQRQDLVAEYMFQVTPAEASIVLQS